MKSYVLVILIILIVMISGCISVNDKPKLAGGITINDFSTEPTEVDENDVVSFFLEAENTGDVTASCVKAELFGVENWRYHGKKITVNLGGFYADWEPGTNWWQVIGRVNLDPKEIADSLGICSGSGGAIYNAFCNTIKNAPPATANFDWKNGKLNWNLEWSNYAKKIACNPATFHPFITQWGDQEMKPRKDERPGDVRIAEWALTPPDLPEGTKATYNVVGRVTYDYKTTGAINIKAVSEREYDRNKNIISNALIERHSNSPVLLSITQGAYPIVVEYKDWEQGGPAVEHYTYQFELRNVGDGFPITLDKSGLIMGKFTISGVGARFEDCLGQSGTTIFIDGSVADKIRLRDTGVSKFSCVIAVDVPAWKDRDLGTISILYDLRYLYYTQQERTITVTGKADY